jgi:hypothetical protein
VGGDLKGQSVVKRVVLLEGMLALDGIEKLGLEATRELDVDDGTHDLGDLAVLSSSIIRGTLLLELLVLGNELLHGLFATSIRVLALGSRGIATVWKHKISDIYIHRIHKKRHGRQKSDMEGREAMAGPRRVKAVQRALDAQSPPR